MTPQEYTQQMHGEVPQGGLMGAARVPLLMGQHSQNNPNMLGMSMGGARMGMLAVSVASVLALHFGGDALEKRGAGMLVTFGLPAAYAASGYYLAKL